MLNDAYDVFTKNGAVIRLNADPYFAAKMVGLSVQTMRTIAFAYGKVEKDHVRVVPIVH